MDPMGYPIGRVTSRESGPMILPSPTPWRVSAVSREHECMTNELFGSLQFPSFSEGEAWGTKHQTPSTNLSRIWWENQLNGIPEEICFKKLATFVLLKNRSEWMAFSFEKIIGFW